MVNMKITSKTACYGLFGFPVSHSLSPFIHNYIFKISALDALYLCFPVEAAWLEKAFIGALTLGLKGCNITIPHKEAVIPFIDVLSKDAKKIGAVNTVKFENGKSYGFNTDSRGFYLSLVKEGFSFAGKKTLILGAGGACKAISYACALSGVSSVYLYDIDTKKALIQARRLRTFFPDCQIAAIPKPDAVDTKQIQLLINTTPLGMSKKDSLPIDSRLIHPGMIVYDVIYNPCKTSLLRYAEKRGAFVMNGLSMLLYQGLLALEIWFGKSFMDKEELVLKELQSAL